MPTDFNKPVVTDNYAVLIPAIAQAHKDLAMMLEPTLTSTSTNIPTGAVRWNATTVRWERYNGSSWVTLPSAGNNVYAISISGTAATASALTSTRSNWLDTPAKDNVVGLLSWRNYGSGHVIFDASKGLSPDGTTVSDTDPHHGWGPTYPTLMGWNGVYTYGVRVDSARVSDMATKLATARTIGGVSFDGTANINLPGVNTTGNQNTTGNAATATTAASCSGNAATATAAKDGYFTAVGINPRLEIHKPGASAGQWAINSSDAYVFQTTSGNGVSNATILTLTPTGVLSTLGGFSGNADTATFANNAFGIGQSNHDVLGARSAGVNYSNTSGRTMLVTIGLSNASNRTCSLFVNGVKVCSAVQFGGYSAGSLTAVVPAGSYYQLTPGSADSWCEFY